MKLSARQIANELYTTPVRGETRMLGNIEQALNWKRQIDRLDEITK